MDKWYIARQVPITGLAQALRDSRLRWVFAERMEDTLLAWLEKFIADTTVSLDRWTHGRAFGPDLEVAWWREETHLRARAIVASGAPPSGIGWLEHTPHEWAALPQDRQAILLAGERDPAVPADEPTWSSTKIARYLPYPASAEARRVALVEQGYQQDGIIVARRLVQVQQAG